MTKLRDKIELKNKIDELYSKVQENQFKIALNKHKNNLGQIDDVLIINGLINEFNPYDYMENSDIKEFLDYLKSSLDSNKLFILLDESISKMKSSKNAVSYSKAILQLESFTDKNEDEIKEGVYNELSDFLWIPEIKGLLSRIQIVSGDPVNTQSYKPKLAYVKEQYQIKNLLEVLYHKLDEGSSARVIVKKYIDKVDHMPQIELLKGLERELRVYS